MFMYVYDGPNLSVQKHLVFSLLIKQNKTKNLILRVHTTPNISNTMNITHFNQPSQIFFGFVGVKVKIDSGTFVFNKTGKFFKNSWEFRNDDNDSIHIQSNVLNLKTKSKHLHACSTISQKRLVQEKKHSCPKIIIRRDE